MGGAAPRAAVPARRRRDEVAVRSVRLTRRPAARLGALGAALAGLVALQSPLLAQAGAAAPGEACRGRVIRAIQVEPRTIFGPEDSLIPGFVRALGNSLHWRTREATVRSDLLFAVGDSCDPARLAESERLLRTRPYLRYARVTAVPDSGGVTVVVETRDELSLEARARVSGPGFPVRFLKLGEDNVLGRGLEVRGQYDHSGPRLAYQLSGTAWHLAGRRIEADVLGGESGVGPLGEETVRRSFETDFDRVAWRESARYLKDPFPLESSAFGTVLQPEVSFGADAGFAERFGRPGELKILGAALSADRQYVEGAPTASLPGLDSAAAAALSGRFVERRVVRAHLLVGARSIRFQPHLGLDAVHAVEDVPVGAQAGLVLGRSLFGGGGLQHDWFAAMDLNAGAVLTRGTLLFAQGKVEGRFLTAAGRWDGVLADGTVLLYAVGARATTVAEIAGAGGWNTSTPFQLLLAGPDGLRGYGTSMPVGRRIVFHLETRYFLGGLLGFADLGAAAFAEAGRGWAGDAAFGENTGLVGDVGAGLRVAVPRGSRRTYRLDVTVPLSRGYGPELRLAVGQQFGFFHGEPQDVVRSRERLSSVTVFDFPRF